MEMEEALATLGVHCLDEGFVDDVLQGCGATDPGDVLDMAVPPATDQHAPAAALRSLVPVVRAGPLRKLSDHDYSPRALVVALYHWLRKSDDPPAQAQAAALYFAVLESPGSMSFRVYHEFVLRAAERALAAQAETALAPRRKRGTAVPVLPAYLVAGLEGLECFLLSPAAGGYNVPAEVLSGLVDLLAAATRSAHPVLASSSLDTLKTILGSASRAATLVLRTFIANVLMTYAPVSSGATIPRPMVQVRNQTLAALSVLCQRGPEVRAMLEVGLQHLCVAVPERSEFRSYASEAVVHLLGALVRSSGAAEAPSSPGSPGSPSSPGSPGSRASSSRAAAAPRSAAARFFTFLHTLSLNTKSALRLFSVEVASAVLQVDIPGVPIEALYNALQARVQDASPAVRAKAVSGIALLLRKAAQTLSHEPCVPLIRARVADEKWVVRKAAVQALEVLGEAALVGDRIRDESLSVRKQALASLNALLASDPARPDLQRVWVASVVPGCSDLEHSFQEKALDAIYTHLFEPIYTPGDRGHVWALWSALSADQLVYLPRICSIFAKTDRIGPPLYRALAARLRADAAGLAEWRLMQELVAHKPALAPVDLLTEAWTSSRYAGTPVEPCLLALLSQVAQMLGDQDRTRIRAVLADKLTDFSESDGQQQPDAIHARVILYAQLSQGVKDWCSDLVLKCTDHLYKAAFSDNPDCAMALLLVGELALIKPQAVTPRLQNVIQTLTTPVLDMERNAQVAIPYQIRAHAFVALGKLCLHDQTLAKKCVVAFVKELQTSQSPQIRNNAMVVLCDLCVRYPSVVDPYVSTLASCLRDPSELVRRQALSLLTRLLQEDFLKWKGALVYRFLAALVDSSESVRDFARYCLLHILLPKSPNLFISHFVEAVFHFNGHRDHPVYNQFTQTERDRVLFAMRGEAHRAERFEIYYAMLATFSDEQKFLLGAKLCEDILAGVVDEVLPLDGGEEIVADALHILSSKFMKVSVGGKGAGAGDDDDAAMLAGGEQEEEAAVAKVVAVARGKFLAQINKKNLMDNVVPVVIELKRILENASSPMLGDLMAYLRYVMKEYKDEVLKILAADKQLAVELEYDLERFEKQNSKAKRAPNAADPAPDNATTTATVTVPIKASPSRSAAPSAAILSPKTPASQVSGAKPAMSPVKTATPRSVPKLKKSKRGKKTKRVDAVDADDPVGISPPRQRRRGGLRMMRA